MVNFIYPENREGIEAGKFDVLFFVGTEFDQQVADRAKEGRASWLRLQDFRPTLGVLGEKKALFIIKPTLVSTAKAILELPDYSNLDVTVAIRPTYWGDYLHVAVE